MNDSWDTLPSVNSQIIEGDRFAFLKKIADTKAELMTEYRGV